MAMAEMYAVNEKIDFLQKMIVSCAQQCGVPPPEDYLETWQMKLPFNLSTGQASSWYRMLNLMKRKQRLMERSHGFDKLLPCYSLELPEDKQEEIQRILNNISMDTPPNVSQIRSGKNYDSQNVFEKYKYIEDSDFKKKFLQSVTGTLEEKIIQNKHYNLSYKRDHRLDFEYNQEWEKKIRNPRYLSMLDYRRKLPAYNVVEDLIRMVSQEQIILVSGDTGCGKTTQIPQFILDYELKAGRGSLCHIICTQPRRISAISIAERVAQERAEKLGDSVGYQIRLEKVRPRKTGSILYCTTGTLLQMMQADPVLRDVSHVILDEVHERNTMTDFILAILKDIILLRQDLKVILMSASLNAERFSEYFNNCPSIEIPGRSFPVTDYYLEDILQMTGFRFRTNNAYFKNNMEDSNRKMYVEEYLLPYIRSPNTMKSYSADVLESLMSPQAEQLNMDLISDLISFISENEPPGAILVFMPGWDRILKLLNVLDSSGKFPQSHFVIVPLHSMLSTIGQKNVFNTPAPGVRKIVIATNIAETSITIDDVVYVVDSGMEKLKDFDIADNISTLEERWVSLANAKQRKGRAGRVQAGYCYKLYSRPKEMTLSPFQLPEMLRTRLDEVILQTKVLQLGQTETFLSKVLDPPTTEAVRLSLELLQGMNALDEEENLTPLGFHLASLPIDPMAGKMILFGALFGCLDPISSIACSISFKDCFTPPTNKLKEMDMIKLKLAENTKSDHILYAKVFEKWREAKLRNRAKEFTTSNYLSNSTLHMVRDLKKQLVRHLANMGFLKSTAVEGGMANYHSSNIPLLRSIVCASLYPNIAIVSKVKPREQKNHFTVIMSTLEDQHVQVHQRSVNSMVEEFESVFFAYYSKMRSFQTLLHDTTMVYPMALIFFCHNFHIEEVTNKKIIVINKKIRFSCSPATANLIQELRAWLDWLMGYKVAHPCSIDWTQNNDENFILKAIIELLSLEIRVKDPEIPDEALQEQAKKRDVHDQPCPNFGQFPNYFGQTSQLLTLENSTQQDHAEEQLPWNKKMDQITLKSVTDIQEMSGSDMSSMSGEEGLLSNSSKKRKKIKKMKTENDQSNDFVKKGIKYDVGDNQPWIRSLVCPKREKQLQVAVIIRDLQPMTPDEANIVKRSLVLDVGLALRGVGPGCNGKSVDLRFTESNLVPPGLLLLSCLDEITRDWMLNWTPPKLQFSPNRFLQVVRGDSLVCPEKLQVAIVLKDFLPMTSNDADDVRSGLVEDVSLVLGGGLNIQFTNLEFVDPGWLLITCMDRTSRDWVMKWHPPIIRTQQTYVVSADILPWPIRIGFSIQSEQKPDWDSVCYYIRLQNSSIDCDSWIFVDAIQAQDGSWMLTLSVSPDSIMALDKIGWKIFYQIDYVTVYQFGRVPLMSSMAAMLAPPFPMHFPPVDHQFQQPQPFYNSQHF